MNGPGPFLPIETGSPRCAAAVASSVTLAAESGELMKRPLSPVCGEARLAGSVRTRRVSA